LIEALKFFSRLLYSIVKEQKLNGYREDIFIINLIFKSFSNFSVVAKLK